MLRSKGQLGVSPSRNAGETQTQAGQPKSRTPPPSTSHAGQQLKRSLALALQRLLERPCSPLGASSLKRLVRMPNAERRTMRAGWIQHMAVRVRRCTLDCGGVADTGQGRITRRQASLPRRGPRQRQLCRPPLPPLPPPHQRKEVLRHGGACGHPFARHGEQRWP